MPTILPESIKKYLETGEEKHFESIKQFILAAKNKEEAIQNRCDVMKELNDLSTILKTTTFTVGTRAIKTVTSTYILPTIVKLAGPVCSIPPFVSEAAEGLTQILPTVGASIAFFKTPIVKAAKKGIFNKIIELENLAIEKINQFKEPESDQTEHQAEITIRKRR